MKYIFSCFATFVPEITNYTNLHCTHTFSTTWKCFGFIISLNCLVFIAIGLRKHTWSNVIEIESYIAFFVQSASSIHNNSLCGRERELTDKVILIKVSSMLQEKSREPPERKSSNRNNTILHYVMRYIYVKRVFCSLTMS